VPLPPRASMTDSSPDRHARKLQDRLTDLRLRVDLKEITTAAQFRAALEQDGDFTLADRRVRAACERAGLGAWIDHSSKGEDEGSQRPH
jgi:hypothetical protein